MFNFFDELKKSLKDPKLATSYNIVNISGKILYVEGHTGICTLSKELISFKCKKTLIVVEGRDMILTELMDKTLKISGEIKRVEEM